MTINIRIPTSKNDFKRIAVLHEDGIKEGFLSSLGTPFLSALYKGIAGLQSSGVAVAADNNGKIQGFVSYTADVGSCYKKVLSKHCIILFFSFLPNIYKLWIYKKIFETLFYPIKKRNTPVISQNHAQSRPELLSMAVDPAFRGAGIGKKLIEYVDKWMKHKNINGYFVVTHAIDEGSNNFYRHCGFTQTHSFENHGKPMNEYYKDLSNVI